MRGQLRCAFCIEEGDEFMVSCRKRKEAERMMQLHFKKCINKISSQFTGGASKTSNTNK